MNLIKSFLVVIMLAGLCMESSAVTYHVKTNGDDSKDGTTWNKAFQTLQKALSVAVFGDEIWVATGTYYPDEGPGVADNDRTVWFELIHGVDVYGGFAGNENSIAQRDWKANETILSGDLMQNDGPNFTNNADNTQRIVRGNGNNGPFTVTFDGFTVTAGNGGIGVGMDAFKTPDLTVNNCLFTRNKASFGGAGVSVNNGSNVTFNACLTFLSN